MDFNIIVILHVLAVVAFLGPLSVALYMFPKAARDAHESRPHAHGRVSLLYSMSKNYVLWSLLVPLLGFGAFFTVEDAMKNYFVHTGILLSVIIWAMLAFYVVPKQKTLVADLGLLDDEDLDPTDEMPAADWVSTPSRLTVATYIFYALWIITFVLMFLEPAKAAA